MPTTRLTAHVIAGTLAIGSLAEPAGAATEPKLATLFTFAGILGRAAACDVDVRWPTKLVSAWMDDNFVPGTPEQQEMLGSFVEHMLANAALQRSDPGAVSCAEVARTVQTLNWPAPGM